VLPGRGAVALWAEDPDETPGRRTGHPFAVAADVLADHLGLAGDAVTADHMALLLPSTATAPVAADRPPPDDIVLRAWQVPILTLASGDTLRHVVRATDHRFDASVRYLLGVLSFAEELVARGGRRSGGAVAAGAVRCRPGAVHRTV
jgi:hypothetical protein